jgi:hypothetical protein
LNDEKTEIQNDEKIMNFVYPELKMYVRDADLDEKYISKYKNGTIIYERTFVDCTFKIGGIIKNTRYVIFSNNIKNISNYEHGTNWGLCLANLNSAFKILLVKNVGDKNLIVLLHIPVEYDDFFLKNYLSFDKDLIEKATNNFNECLGSSHIPDLTEDWYKRLSFPVGMDDNAELWTRPELKEPENQQISKIENEINSPKQLEEYNEEKEVIKMDYNNELVETIISNEYDYSNVVVDRISLLSLAQYVNEIYIKMTDIFNEEEKKNEQLKWEFQTYEYKKGYINLEFNIRDKNYSNISCESYEALLSASENGSLNNISSFSISMKLNYSKGKQTTMIALNNSFDITFKPYEIRFIRKSNYNEVLMNQIEEGIHNIMDKFKVLNTVFSIKE